MSLSCLWRCGSATVFHCLFVHLTCLRVHLWVHLFSIISLCVYICKCGYSLSLTIILYLPLANKEEVVQKARPVSSDVGSTNPNFSDLMDEFIQERLRAKGTAVSTTHMHTLIKAQSLTFWPLELNFFLLRAVVAAAQEAWRFPGTCRSSWRQVRVLDHDPQTITVPLMTREFPLNGRHLQVPAVLMSSAQTASRTPSTPSSTPPASLIVRNKTLLQNLWHFFLYKDYHNLSLPYMFYPVKRKINPLKGIDRRQQKHF